MPEELQFVKAESKKEIVGVTKKDAPLGWQDVKEFKERGLTLYTMNQSEVDQTIPIELQHHLVRQHQLWDAGVLKDDYDFEKDPSDTNKLYQEFASQIRKREAERKIQEQ